MRLELHEFRNNNVPVDSNLAICRSGMLVTLSGVEGVIGQPDCMQMPRCGPRPQLILLSAGRIASDKVSTLLATWNVLLYSLLLGLVQLGGYWFKKNHNILQDFDVGCDSTLI